MMETVCQGHHLTASFISVSSEFIRLRDRREAHKRDTSILPTLSF